MAYYILCGWMPWNFIVNFCVVTFLLVCDFWTVRITPLHHIISTTPHSLLSFLYVHPRPTSSSLYRAG